MESSKPPVDVGDVVAGKYRVERLLGAGGMGAVVEVTHLDLGEKRAIKFMLPRALANASATERSLPARKRQPLSWKL